MLIASAHVAVIAECFFVAEAVIFDRGQSDQVVHSVRVSGEHIGFES